MDRRRHGASDVEKARVSKARRKMTDADLVSIIKSHRADSLGVEDGDLSSARARAMDHYHGRPYGNEVDGRSQVVSRDLQEAVDWVMPAIMRVFTQTGSLGEFDPVGPEDTELAQQESDYTNQVMMKDNNGFMVLHDAIKDTLLLKNGYAKHYWDVQEKVRETPYTGLSLDQVTLMLQKMEQDGDEVEIMGVDSTFAPLPQAGPQGVQVVPVELFDIRLKVTSKEGKLIWIAVPSEEVRVSKKCRGSLQESPFTEHVTRKTRSDLIEMGMDADFVYSLASWDERDNSSQALARDSVDDESDGSQGPSVDRSMDEIAYCEAYIRVDYDGDGIAELRKVVTVSDQIPSGPEWNEQIPAVPMTSFVAKRVPHRHVGESLDDEIADLQEIMTVLKRQLLDNIYRVNNAEMAVNENANLRDFLTSTPGGVKRIKTTDPVQNAFSPIVTTPIIDKILPVIDYFDSSKETRTGISKATTGLDPDTLQQTTKGAFLENLNRASQKTEMITRMIAETGVKESFLQCHAILTRHQDRPRMVQLRGNWVNVNPKDWSERTDLTARVGLGTGNKEQKQQTLMMLSQLQDKAAQAGLVGPVQVHALFEDIAKALETDIPGKYVMAPGSPEHQQQLQQMQGGQQANQLAEAEQVKAQASMQVNQARTEAQMQIEAARQQFNREKEMLHAQMKQRDAEEDRRLQIVLERMKQQGEDNRAAMTNEVKLMIEGMRFDLGRPGISAGVQGSQGAPLPDAMPEQPMGATPPEPQQPDPMA